MPVLRHLVPLLVLLPLAGQTPPSTMAPEWDIRVILNELAGQADRLLPALDQIDPKSWQSQGASETYAAQLTSCKEQAKALAQGARQLARKPDVLSTAFELYIRITALDNMVHSLQEGIRRYQNPAVAEMLTGLMSEGNANRDRFQRYIVDLAGEREQQLGVMDKEAQRCRGILARQPVEIPKSTPRKK